MRAPFSLFLALRFLKPKRTFVSIITLVSVLGVAFGVWALIVVISVMTGFDLELRKKVLGFDPHIIVGNDDVLRTWRPIEEELKLTPHIVATAPFVQGPVIAEFAGRRMTPNIRGIDVEAEMKMTDLKKAIVEGELDLDGDKVVIGIELAASLGCGVGDFITVYSPGNIGKILEELNQVEKDGADKKTVAELREMIVPQDLTVTGIFETGRFAYDADILLVPLYIGQELYGLEDSVQGISARVDDPYRAPQVAEALLNQLPAGLSVRTWIDLNKQFFDAVRLERNVMFFILMIIVVVAGFGIMNTLITVTVQKRREIGIMKALGATGAQIIWVFLCQGIFVGLFGTGLGIGAGLVTVQFRNGFKDWLASTLGIEIFPRAIYQFSEIPAQVVPGDVLLISVCAFVICSLAALLPAWSAARLDPVKALRYE